MVTMTPRTVSQAGYPDTSCPTEGEEAELPAALLLGLATQG